MKEEPRISRRGQKEDCRVESGAESISIGNALIRLAFDNAANGFGILQIQNKETGYEFLSTGGRHGLWKLKLKNSCNDFLYIDNTVDSERSHNIERDPDGEGANLKLAWKGIAADSEMDALDVQVSIRLGQTSLTYWKIDVTNRSREYGAWQTCFPDFGGLRTTEEEGIETSLAIPKYLGHLVKNPIDKMPVKTIYPSKNITMQFSTFLRGSNGLYLATHDPEAHYKRFNYEADGIDCIRYKTINFPEDMGKAGIGYCMPYEAVVGVYDGDWITSCKIYRAWALKQKWCKQGPLSSRKDIPQWFKNTIAWVTNIGHIGDNDLDGVIVLKKKLNVPVAFQWYGWTEGRDPDYFPPKPDFKEWIERFHESDVYIVPYMNSMIWHMDNPSWILEAANRWSSKAPFVLIEDVGYHSRDYDSYLPWLGSDRDLASYIEHWNGRRYAAICPYTKFWQHKNLDFVIKVVEDYDVDGVYLDQIASWYPALCFDPSHGHPIGGGKHYVEGYRKLISLAREKAREKKPQAVLTTEDHAEPYMDLLDGFLTCNSIELGSELIPMFHQVYSGYCATFGRYSQTKDPVAFVMKNAQMFTWGDQLGWFDLGITGSDSPEVSYLKVLAEAFAASQKFLSYGEMLRPPNLEGDIPVLKGEYSQDSIVEMSAVLCSAWKAEDGTMGLVFTNFDTSPHRVSYAVNLLDFGLPRAEEYILTRLDQTSEKVSWKSPILTRSEELPARSALVLQVSPQKE